jgi:tetratricopeptide (TPR) repeat protein
MVDNVGTITYQDPQRPPAGMAGREETIESYKLKIAWLSELIEEGRAQPEQELNEEDVAKEISFCHAKMGDIFLTRGDFGSAEVCYETALLLNPRNLSVRMNLLKTRKTTTREDVMKAFLAGLLAERPRDAGLYNQLGRLHYNLHENAAALDCFTKAIGIDPNDADSLYGMADIQQTKGDMKAAEENYIRAMKLRPLIKVAADKPVPDFSVLVIIAPLLGNTPTNYLMNASPYERNIFPLFSHTQYDMELLKRSGQVIVNAVSEADQDQAMLPLVADLVDQLGMPVINHPAKIKKTTREGIAHLLQDMPHCRCGRVVRHIADEETTEEALQAKIPFSMPLLARPTGTHGGEKFEKINSLTELKDFIAQHPDTDHYLIEYIDYKSPDNYFRKYRFIFVNDQIMPYHLAIGDHWKVHHNTTDMANHQRMQDEEKAFLENPSSVFSAQNYETLRTIQQAVGLEYFGIDCGIDQDGNLVVFEVNASMMVHPYNEAFPYKNPFVHNIKLAFGEMLRKCATQHRK